MIARQILPAHLYGHVVRLTREPFVGKVDFGSLRRVKPVSKYWGFDRGKPVDRYYIEHVLSRHTSDIQGHVLEIGDNAYTLQFGRERVTKSDILHVAEGYPKATIVADLTQADHVPSDTFDCIICTQTLQLIYETTKAIRSLHRMLKPGGVLLLTIPGISQISRYDMDRWGDYWRFTRASAQRLFSEVFPKDSVRIETHGNVLAATAFLHGLSVEELTEEELDYSDPDYEVTIAIRAMKPR
ncbi:MAG: class I SAM-dependent methyltransferase [Hyphomicrobiales bacterium]